MDVGMGIGLLVVAICGACLVGCFLSVTNAQKQADRAVGAERIVQKSCMALASERARVTVLERESEALRRELRKLGGKFYAFVRESEPDNNKQTENAHELVSSSPFCANYELAQKEGPYSKAAACECNYCKGRRAMKEAFRESQRAKGHLNPQWVRDHSTGTGNHGE